MLSRTLGSPTSLSQRALAQRRLRRSAARRLLCNTNGCATFMDLDLDREVAVCPICGYSRHARAADPATTH